MYNAPSTCNIPTKQCPCSSEIVTSLSSLNSILNNKHRFTYIIIYDFKNKC